MTGNSQLIEARTTDQRQTLLREAQTRYETNPDWVTFYRDILGLEGIVRQAFRTIEEMIAFEQTEEYFTIQEMLATLRQNTLPSQEGIEPTRVITVRLPKSMHETLRAEAHERHTSMNKLCISKLLQFVDNSLVPKDTKAQDDKEPVAATIKPQIFPNS